MPNKITIRLEGEIFDLDFETEHHLDPEIIQILHDALSRRNIRDWEPLDVDKFTLNDGARVRHLNKFLSLPQTAPGYFRAVHRAGSPRDWAK
jgi:hypothetical protein